MNTVGIIGMIDRIGTRQYLDQTRGVALTDVWSDIMSFQQNATSVERLGYPTQKPRILYERMIKASSNKDDIVLDPFCGCGTTIDAAHTLHRQWIGIDITILALGSEATTIERPAWLRTLNRLPN